MALDARKADSVRATHSRDCDRAVSGHAAHRNLRLPSAGMALLGAGISTYLALFQYQAISRVWEPVFGNGSVVVLNSGLLDPVSRALGFPLHDAALGAAGYLAEAALAVAGSRVAVLPASWLDVLYRGVVLLMGLTSLVLVCLQIGMLHAFCTLCLASAAISEIIVLLSWHELAPSAAFFRRWRFARKPFDSAPFQVSKNRKTRS